MTPTARLSFQERVAGDRALLGTWLTLTDPVVAEIARGSALDFVVIDGEHAPLGPESIHRLVGAAGSADLTVLVRVPTNTPVHIGSALDSGADGVIVPQIRSAADAERAVSASRYPPEGQRGWGPRRPGGYGRRSAEYRAESRDRSAVVVQVELREAVDDLDRILATPGLDAILVGPNDLAGSLGYPGQPTCAEVTTVIDSVIAAAVSARVPVGIACAADRTVVDHWVSRGCRFIAASADYILLAEAFDALGSRSDRP